MTGAVVKKSFLFSQIVFFFVFLSFFSYPSLYGWNARVIKIHDGDTITVMHGIYKHRIRFYGIDCPELGQAYGIEARDFLRSLIRINDRVEITPIDRDRYHRIVGIVEYRGMNLNEELVRQGYAWVYGKYYKKSFRENWYDLQKQARQHHKGLWIAATNGILPLAPWQFRHEKKVSASVSHSNNFNTSLEKRRKNNPIAFGIIITIAILILPFIRSSMHKNYLKRKLKKKNPK